MKKILTIALLGFIAITAFSFNAKAEWNQPTYCPSDELRGTEAYYANFYDGNSGYFVSWSNEDKVKIGTRRGIFDYNSYHFVSVLVGFYEGDKLIKKETTSFYVPKGDSDTAYSNSDIGKRITTHLKTTGKVRIIASTYSGLDFDLLIPMNKNLK